MHVTVHSRMYGTGRYLSSGGAEGATRVQEVVEVSALHRNITFSSCNEVHMFQVYDLKHFN